MTEIINTPLPGVLLIKPKVFADNRGFFLQTFQAEMYRDLGLDCTFVQDNHSRSQRGVLRGLHYQLHYPQGKLVSVASGEVYDVAVDIRQGSPTFGQSYGMILNDINHYQIYVPPGFAHGFCVMSETADFVYKCSEFYHPEDEGGVLWNDPDLKIEWPDMEVQLSQKDLINDKLCDISANNLPYYQKGTNK